MKVLNLNICIFISTIFFCEIFSIDSTSSQKKIYINYPISKFTVEKKGEANFQSIQRAINEAIKNNNKAIFIQPGVYKENLDFSKAKNINLTLMGALALGDEGQCEIIGTHIPSNSGSIVLRNFRLTSEKAIYSSKAHGTAHLVIIDSYLNVKDGYTFDLPNWAGIFELFDVNRGNLEDGGIINYEKSELFLYNTGLGSGSKK